MRIGIVVDSTCDLPGAYIQNNNVVLLPITVRIGEAVLADHRDAEAALGSAPAPVDPERQSTNSSGDTDSTCVPTPSSRCAA